MALQGVRVLEFAHVLAGPLSAQILADLGAEVIKIEPPGRGDEVRNVPPFVDGSSSVSTFFLSANRNKQSIALDISTPEGREVALDLIAWADVLIENFSGDVMKRHGLDHASLEARFPKLIYLSISAYGRTGSRADAGGLDPVVAAECGATAMNGNPGDEPSFSTIPWVDLTTAQNGVIAILGALIARGRLGRGQYIDISMYDSGIADMTYIGAGYLGTGTGPERLGRFRPMAPPSGHYTCSDGRGVYVYTISDAAYRRLCVAGLQRADLAEDEKYRDREARRRHFHELVAEFERVFAQHPADYWYERIMPLGIPIGVIRTPREALGSALTAERNMCSEIEHPMLGSIFNLGSPFQRMTLTPAVDPVRAPLLGEHSRHVLRDVLGYEGDRIDSLLRAGIIAVEGVDGAKTK